MAGGNEKSYEQQKKEFELEINKSINNDITEINNYKNQKKENLKKMSQGQVRQSYIDVNKAYSDNYSKYVSLVSGNKIAKPDANVTVFGDKKMDYPAFLKFMKENVKLTYLKAYENKVPEDNDLTRAMFHLLAHDKTGAAEALLRKVDVTYYSGIRALFQTCLLCVNGKENELDENGKAAVALLGELRETGHNLMLFGGERFVTKQYYEAMVKNPNKNNINGGTGRTNLNTNKNNNNKNNNKINVTKVNNNKINVTKVNDNTINLNSINLNTINVPQNTINDYKINIGTSNNNIINNNPKKPNYVIYKDIPGDIIVTNQDILDLAAELHQNYKGCTTFSNVKNVRNALPALETNDDRKNYFLGLLVEGQNARGWEYYASTHVPKEIRNCGNEEELKNYYKANKNLHVLGKAYILRRLHGMEQARKIAAANEKGLMTRETLGENYSDIPKVENNGKGKVKINLKMPKRQTSGNGCWSHGLQMMLLSNGIFVNQEDIRGYRPDYTLQDRQNKVFEERVDKRLKKDDMMNAMEMVDNALAFAPDRMMRSFEIKLPEAAQDYYGVENKLNEEEYIRDAAELASKKIQQILSEDKCTITFTNGAHYLSIKAVNGDKITVLDSSSGKEYETSLREQITDLFHGTYTQGRQAEFVLNWMSKIELDENGKDFLNVPSHYLQMNEDGSLKLPPDEIMKEQYVDSFSRNGIRVSLFGGMDDTEYDRIKRNPLTKKHILAIDHAYIPKKLNAKTLLRDAKNRTPQRTKELNERKVNMLGVNFKPPKYTNTQEERDQAIVKREALHRYTSLLVEFERRNGYFALNDNDKKQFINKPGAILAFRIEKAYQGFKNLYTYMANNDPVNGEIWSKHLLDVEERYRDFTERINRPENSIPANAKIPKVYPLKGYLATNDDLFAGISFLHSMNDKIVMNNFKSMRFKTCRNTGSYDPSILARYAENILEFTDPGLRGNLLKICEQNPVLNEGINTILTFPTTNKNVLELKFKSNQFARDYTKYSADVAYSMYNNRPNFMKDSHNKYKALLQKPEYGTNMPNTRALFVPGQKTESVGELKVIPKDYIPNQDKNKSIHIDRTEIYNDINMIEGNGDGKLFTDKKNDDEKKPEPEKEPEKKPEPEKEPEKKPEPEKEPEKKPEPEKEPEKKPEPEKEKENPNQIKEGKEGGMEDEKNPVLRIMKRRQQYRTFLEQLDKVEMLQNEKGYLNELGKLMDDMAPYTTAQNPKLLSYNELENFLKKYIEIQNNLESVENKVISGAEAYKKFRLVMSKDIRTIHDALSKNANLSEEEKKTARFNLVNIFEEARAVTLTVDEKSIEKEAGNVNKRLHIKTKGPNGEEIDGYFTVHEKPFNFIEEKDKLIKEFTGSENPMIQAFGKYLLFENEFAKPTISYTMMLHQSKGDVDPEVVRTAFESPEKYFTEFKRYLQADLKKFASDNDIGVRSKEYQELDNFVKKYTADTAAVDSLVDFTAKGFALDNKNNILEGLQINRNASLDKRNAAMSAIASLLGVDNVLAKATNMRLKIGNQVFKGTFMETAKGTTIDKLTQQDELMEITTHQLENPELIKSVANLAVLDLICGNPDRHPNNMSFVPMKVKDENGNMVTVLGTVVGFDNDNSFVLSYSNLDYSEMSATPFKHMLIIPVETANKIRDLDVDLVKALLVGYDLTAKEIDATVKRINDLKQSISAGMEHFAKNPTAKLSEDFIKPVSDGELKDISLQNDLVRKKKNPEAPQEGDYNYFSRVHNVFALEKGKDPAYVMFKSGIMKDSQKYAHKAYVAEEKMNKALKALGKGVQPNVNVKNEYETMLKSNENLKTASAKAGKSIWVNSKKYKGEVECNRKLGPIYESANNALKAADTFIEKQRAEMQTMNADSDEYKAQENLLQTAIIYRNNLKDFTDAYKSLTE
ncbi:MAG: hypothetical protein IKO32_03650 [Lachnospiraceae bacterium]|nr:hypothetical protein [Lachnospiraceae bacterium]